MQDEEKNIRKKYKNKIPVWLCVLLAIIIALIVIFTIAYSKYVTTMNGTATSEVAKMICEMDIVASETNSDIINPYCIITLKNYNDNGEMTETSVDYKVEISPKGEISLPSYYWEDSEGVIISYESNLTGSFDHSSKDEQVYKVVFLNSGEEDITKLVNFNLVAVQQQ